MSVRADNRKRLFKLLAVANRELRTTRAEWHDEDYRTILQQCGATEKDGRISATTMTNSQMEQALEHFKSLGFKVKRTAGSDSWRTPRINKLYAMWCALADAGVVKNRDRRAMETFCRQQVKGMSRLQWANSSQLNQAVEMLKSWCVRVNVECEG